MRRVDRLLRAIVGAAMAFLVQHVPGADVHGDTGSVSWARRSGSCGHDQAGVSPGHRGRSFVLETLSVIFQVASYKLWKKRFSAWRPSTPFRAQRMGRTQGDRPLLDHHHFSGAAGVQHPKTKMITDFDFGFRISDLSLPSSPSRGGKRWGSIAIGNRQSAIL